ncbi:hypothetical protein EBZ80_12285 [bacterium]|nr:hypothetical protein [bacterium]
MCTYAADAVREKEQIDMAAFTVQIASKYRNTQEYPLSTDFVVINNPSGSSSTTFRAATSLQDGDPNTEAYLDNPVIYLFRWSGNAVVASTGYVLPNSAMIGTFTNYPALDRVVLPNAFATAYRLAATPALLTNYFKGTLFYLFTSAARTQIAASAAISFYNPVSQTIVLDTSLPAAFFAANPTPPYAFAIVNPSYVQTNNLNVLGTNTFVSLFSENYISDAFLLNGTSSDAWVHNVTRGWALPVSTFSQAQKVLTTTTAFPSYALTDMMELRATDPTPTLFTTQQPTLTASLYSATSYANLTVRQRQQLLSSSVVDALLTFVGETTSTTTYLLLPIPDVSYALVPRTGAECATCRVAFDQVTITFPGLRYVAGQSYFLATTFGAPLTDTSPIVTVTATALAVPVLSFLTNQVVPCAPPDQTSLLFAPSNDSQSIVVDVPQYVFSIVRLSQAGYLYYEPFDYQWATPAPTFLLAQGLHVEWIPLYQRTLGLCAPLQSMTQCYDVKLLFVSLPNDPVEGYSVLPSFFPYFLVEIYPCSGLTTPYQTLFSNNPNMQRVTFTCMIANPRNQVIATYVVVHSAQTHRIKWDPQDNLRFRFALPNGETLRFVSDALQEGVLTASRAAYDVRQLFQFYSDKGVSIQLSFTPVQN